MANFINQSRNRTKKNAGKFSKAAGSTGLSVSGAAFDAGSFKTIAALMTGAAVGGTGIGLLIASGALTLAGGELSRRSAVKTNKHIWRLKSILTDIRLAAVVHNKCSCHSKQNHDRITNVILPYIISQKQSKLHKKRAVAATLGVAGSIETARAVAKKAYKIVRGTQGVDRKRHSFFLASHFKAHDCNVSERIVAELLSLTIDEAIIMKNTEDAIIAELLEDKMKSV